VRLPGQSLIVGVVRRGEALVPREIPSWSFATTSCSSATSGHHRGGEGRGHRHGTVREVTIYGGGRIVCGCPRLEGVGISVRVIERDESRARYVASRAPQGFVLHE
jgi:hypothetical protein